MNNNFVNGEDELLELSIVDNTIENLDEYNSIKGHELEILKEFSNKLLANMKSIPPEFEKILIDNFWDLI